MQGLQNLCRYSLSTPLEGLAGDRKSRLADLNMSALKLSWYELPFPPRLPDCLQWARMMCVLAIFCTEKHCFKG